ncbi:MAG: restriction endonuclease [Planctomycetes bacterium]|nr:restriction endonuclease [Planctomycetota bacterium]
MAYGNIGVDPDLVVGDAATCHVLDLYCAVWSAKDLSHEQAQDMAAKRVSHNRGFLGAYGAAQTVAGFHKGAWLENLSARTGIPVVTAENKRIVAGNYDGRFALFSDKHYRYLLEDPDRLHELSKAQVQHLVADRFYAMGLEVQLIGRVNEADGGVDIVAWPRGSHFPFLMAIQVKHPDSPGTSTSVNEIREFMGLLTARDSLFQFGVFVSTTDYTSDAVFHAKQHARTLRLRKREDLCRWLRSDFGASPEWTELQKTIPLTRNASFTLPASRRWWQFGGKEQFFQVRESNTSQGVRNSDGSRYMVSLLWPDNLFGPDGQINTSSPFVVTDPRNRALSLPPEHATSPGEETTSPEQEVGEDEGPSPRSTVDSE